MKRGYPQQVIDTAILLARNKDRNDLLKLTNKQKKPPNINFITTYNTDLPDLRQIIKNNWNLLTNNTQTQHIASLPIRIIYKRPPTIKDRLVHSKLNKEKNTHRNLPCGLPCITCHYVAHKNSFKSFVTNKIYKIKGQMNCLTSNIIYIIECIKCGKQYVGQTSNTLRKRFTNHLSDIRNNNNKPVSNHFNIEDHNIEHATIYAIDHVDQNQNNTRVAKESAWIIKLRTLQPLGLNLCERCLNTGAATSVQKISPV